MRDPLRHHRAHRREGDFGDSLIQRAADRIAEGIGTTTFLVIALALIASWVLVNGGVAFFSGAVGHVLGGGSFDRPPWVLLNLLFSFEAFFTGSLVVLASKAQAKRDRAREKAEATHREELAAEHQAAIEANTRLTQEVHALAEEIRKAVK
ncbi:MAG: DUF1003 domain-containing protein [Patescibacteria group bacterium]|nr:DUF1003 domain-containing protein [Patescibacteria group bacterium]